MYKLIKRILDIVFSAIAIVLLSWLLIIIAIAIKCDSKGPVLFKQERLGKNAKIFNCLKFRSMIVDAEQQGTGQYSFEGDPRVTKVGKFIRATSIDELPQLFNILKGDMSFIGPRPPLTYHPWPLEEYTKEQLRMFEVRPGLSGWAQVNGRKAIEWHERIKLNIFYVNNMSLCLDLKIVFMTIGKVLKRADNQNHGVTVVPNSEYYADKANEIQMPKALFVATVRSHIGQFHMPFIRKLNELGCTVDGAYKDNSEQKKGLDLSALDNVFEIDFSRSPYSVRNIRAYKQLKKVIDNGDYDVIHCHTPVGAVMTRLAARDARKRGTKVIYTAHGFHFYKGASALNWKLFYPIEKHLAKHTDCLILINNEDYELVKEKQFEVPKIVKINGVGVDLSKFSPVTAEEKSALRREFEYKDSDFIMIYPADFCARKNQVMLFEVMKKLLAESNDFKLLLPGSLALADEFIKKAKEMGVYDSIAFMGYRRDIEKLVALSDVSLSSARQEGLPINLVEAMAVGNPIVATDVRGNNDLVENGVNGYLVAINDSNTMAEKLLEMYRDRSIIDKFGSESLEMAKKYSEEAVIPELLKIYSELGVLTNVFEKSGVI